MVNVSVCIGSSCHIKGSRKVLNRLQCLIEQNGFSEKIDFRGAFCMGLCKPGVSVSVNDEVFSVDPETVDDFFEKEIKSKI